MQKSFPYLEYANKKKRTRRDRVLAETDSAASWGKLDQAIELFYPERSERAVHQLDWRMLRMYMAQQYFGLSGECVEDATTTAGRSVDSSASLSFVSRRRRDHYRQFPDR